MMDLRASATQRAKNIARGWKKKTDCKGRDAERNQVGDVRESDKEKIRKGDSDKEGALVGLEVGVAGISPALKTAEDRAEYDKISGVYVGPGLNSIFEGDKDLGIHYLKLHNYNVLKKFIS